MESNHVTTLPVVILAARLVAPSSILVQEKEASPEEAIRQATDDYEAALAEGDLEGLLATVSDDVLFYPPGEPPMVRKEAYREWLRPLFEQFELEESITYEGLKIADDWAVGWFSYTFVTRSKGRGEATTEEGHGIAGIERQPDGTWKLSHGVWNTDGPPAQEQ